MREIAAVFMAAAIFFMATARLLRKSAVKKHEQEALLVLLYMMLSHGNCDANMAAFRLEKYSRHNRKEINLIRIGNLRNRGDMDSVKKGAFFDTIAVLYSNGTKRALEFMEGDNELRKSDKARTLKFRNEIANSLGVVLTLIIMFLIIIYFLSPYTGLIVI